MLLELLKNALRATVDAHDARSGEPMRPVTVVVAHGEEDVTIRISDEGGGIRRSEVPRLWTYVEESLKYSVCGAKYVH